MGRKKEVQVQVQLPRVSSWLCPESLKWMNQSPIGTVFDRREKGILVSKVRPGLQRQGQHLQHSFIHSFNNCSLAA